MHMTVSEFIRRTNIDKKDIPGILRNRIGGELGEDTKAGEYTSWVNSYDELAKVLNACNPGIKELQIILEYNFARTPFRCDAILAGRKNEADKILIIELKQWEQGRVFRADHTNVIAYGERKEHPLHQALGYANLFINTYAAVQEHNITVDSCAFLHNYVFNDPIEQDVLYLGYEEFVRKDDGQIKMFGANEYHDLVDYINRAFNGVSETVIDRIENSDVRLASFIDNFHNVLEGQPVFHPTEEQNRVIGNILHNLNKDEDRHQVFVVKGGPGTGKTVLAFHLLVQLGADVECGGRGLQSVKYASKNTKLVKTFLSILNQGDRPLPAYNNRTAEMIISQINSVITSDDCYACLIVDESQRLLERYIENKEWREGMLKKLIDKCKNVVFLLDDDQKLAFNDIRFMDQLNTVNNENNITVLPDYNDNAQVSDYTLYQAFRTFGSRTHLNWIDRFLGYEYARNQKCELAEGYNIRVVRTPDDLFHMVHDKEENGESARVIAGLCWLWKDEHKNDNTYADISINDNGIEYIYSWNRADIDDWSINPDTIDEVGCVHTVIGQEFDYAGVIIGNDLVYRGGQVIPDPDNNTQFMRYKDDNHRVNGMPLSRDDRQGVLRLSESSDRHRFEEARELVRNHYHVLLTRGKKGCYIYCVDPELQRHLCQLIGQKDPVNYHRRYELLRVYGEEVIGNNTNHSYHRPDCQYAPRKPEKRVEFDNVEEAREAGYRPCRTCNP